ncbi:g5900 [Coccomyxa elongata]
MAFTTGITGTFSIAYEDGGSATAVWGWISVALCNIFVALSMAEIVSSYPMSGGPYFWCLELTNNNPKYVIIGWITGWLNVLGQFATTAYAGIFLAQHLSAMWLLSNGHAFSPEEILLVYAIVLVAGACVSSVPTRWAKYHALVSAAFLLVGGTALIVALPLVAPTHQTARTVFLDFNVGDVAKNGLPNVAYMFLIGTIMPQGTFIGFELPAQFVEETKKGDTVAPRAIVLSVLTTAVFGFAYVLSLLFCIQENANLMDGEAGGYLVGQIFNDVFQARYGTNIAGVCLLAIPLVTTFNSTTLSLSSNARMLWSFARDKGVPLHGVWSALNTYTETPVNAVWAMAALAFLLGLPMLYSLSVFNALVSISSIGLYVSYGIPILVRVIEHRNFQPGPFQLGRWHLPINLAAISWVVVSSTAFILPTMYPVSFETFNWTCATVGAVIIGVLAAWYAPKYGARHWYHGKSHTLESRRDLGSDSERSSLRRLPSAPSVQKLTLMELIEDLKSNETDGAAISVRGGPAGGDPLAAAAARRSSLELSRQIVLSDVTWSQQQPPCRPPGSFAPTIRARNSAATEPLMPPSPFSSLARSPP